MKLESTRASEVRPAMAMPTCSSMGKSFFWYEESSSALRWRVAGERVSKMLVCGKMTSWAGRGRDRGDGREEVP